MKTKSIIGLLFAALLTTILATVSGVPSIFIVPFILVSLFASVPKGVLGANMIDTLLTESVAKWNPQYNAFETAMNNYGAFKAFQDDSNSPFSIASPELKAKAQASFNTALKTPVFKNNTLTLTASRPVTITDFHPQSAMVTLSFVTINAAFTLIPAVYLNNHMTKEEAFKNQMLNTMNAVAKALNDSSLTVLNSDKNQIAPSLLGKYTFGASILDSVLAYGEIYGTNTPRLYSDLGLLLDSLNMQPKSPNYKVIGNGGVRSVMRAMKNQYGSNNSVNYQEETMNPFYYAQTLADAANKIATGYAVSEGSLGFITRSYPDSYLGLKSTDGHEWGSVILPGLNIPMDTYYYEGAADKSAVLTGATASKVESFGLSLDYCLFTNYNSDKTTKANPILKFNVANA